jgi:hypothetical protein
LLWDGEWEVTYVTFRNMGAAFAVAMLGIYLLVVAQFGSFRLPLLILVPVPLTLIRIVLGHRLFRAPTGSLIHFSDRSRRAFDDGAIMRVPTPGRATSHSRWMRCPHMGQDESMHYALGCNGSGVAMTTYLGYQTARKIVRKAYAVCAFDMSDFPDHPPYSGNPWFLPVVRGYHRLRDSLDRLFLSHHGDCPSARGPRRVRSVSEAARTVGGRIYVAGLSQNQS